MRAPRLLPLPERYACGGPDVYPRDPSLARETEGTIRLCLVLELGRSIPLTTHTPLIKGVDSLEFHLLN